MALLKPGDVVTADCRQVDQLPPRALALAGDGTLEESAAAADSVMARGRLFLASRRDAYVAELAGNGLAVCEDFHPFAAAGAPLRLALELAQPDVLISGEDDAFPGTEFVMDFTGPDLRLRAGGLMVVGVSVWGAGAGGSSAAVSDSLGSPYALAATLAGDAGNGPGNNVVFLFWAVVPASGPCVLTVSRDLADACAVAAAYYPGPWAGSPLLGVSTQAGATAAASTGTLPARDVAVGVFAANAFFIDPGAGVGERGGIRPSGGPNFGMFDTAFVGGDPGPGPVTGTWVGFGGSPTAVNWLAVGAAFQRP